MCDLREKLARTAATFLLLSGTAFAQYHIPLSGGSGRGNGHYSWNFTIRLEGLHYPVILNAPFSGEEASSMTQTMPDGTNIQRPNIGLGEKFWRDSQGRVRIERSLSPGASRFGITGAPNLIQIMDPVAGLIYLMDRCDES